MPMVTYNIALLEYTRQIRQQILKLYKSGVPVAKIASQLHLTPTSTYRHLKAMHITLEPRKRNVNGQYIGG
jgi:DNA invertase Pin-like site-specific DNA recombinase